MSSDKVINYLKAKIAEIHKVIPNRFCDTAANFPDKVNVQTVLHQSMYHLDEHSFRFKQNVSTTIARAILIAGAFKTAKVGNALAFREALLLELLMCKNDNVLNDFSIGVITVATKIYNHTLLMLTDFKEEKIKYIVDPYHNIVLYIAEEDDIANYLVQLLDEFSATDKFIESFKMENYTNMPYELEESDKTNMFLYIDHAFLAMCMTSADRNFANKTENIVKEQLLDFCWELQ